MFHRTVLATLLIFSVYIDVFADEQANVKKVFTDYRMALLQQNGTLAWDLTDSHTHNYYNDMQLKSINLPRKDLDRLNIISKFIVIRLRNEFRLTELKEMTGQSMFIMSVNRGWISKSSVESLDKIDRVVINGNMAHIFLPQQPQVPAFFFIKENNKWKLSLWKNMDLGNMAFEQMRKESDLNEYDFIEMLINKVSSYKFNPKTLNTPIE